MTLVADSPLSFFDLLAAFAPSGWCGRTSLESCRRTEEGILEPSSGRWKSSGTGGPTERWTLSSLEYHRDAVASSLSDILETPEDWLARHPGKTYSDFLAYLLPYFLSDTACRGILRRAEARGRKLPEALGQALEEMAG